MSTEASSEDIDFNLAEEWLRTAELQIQNQHVAAAAAAADLSLFRSSLDQQSPYNFSPLEASKSAAASGFGEELLDMPSHGVGSMISAAASSLLHAASATSAELMMPIVKSDPPSSSSRSSYKNSSSSSQALDLSTHDLCKKVTLNEAMMHQAIEKLGGGEMGLKILMDKIRFWVGQRTSSNCCNTTLDQQISISDSLQQLCSTPPAAATTSPTTCTTSLAANPMSTSPACCSLQSYCVSGDLESTEAVAASFYGAQPRSQAPKPRWQQQQQQVQQPADAWLHDHEMQNPKKRRRTVACGAMGLAGMDSFVHTGSAHMSFRSGAGARQQFWDTVPLRARLHHDKRSSAASWNYVSSQSAAATRAARKHRMACQRLSKSSEALATAASSYNGSSKSNSSSLSLAMHQQQPDDDSPLAVERLPLLSHVAKKLQQPITMSSSGVNKLQSSGNPFISNRHKGTGTGTLVMLLHKLLRPSDVSSLGRIVLPKKEAESCLPYLAVKEGMLLTMEDFYTGKTWKVRYRYWPNNRSRMYLIENTGVFVRSHQLQEGDLLILYRNVEHDKIVIRGKKNAQLAEVIVPAVTDENLALMTKDSKAPAMPIPRLDTKQRVVMKQGKETVDHDQTSSQLKLKLHCAISAAFETAANSPKVESAQFEDPSELGDLMQGLIRDDKQYGTCGLAGGKNLEQLVSFPSLEFGDLLMEDDVARVPCDFNLPASICKIEQE